MECNCSMRTKLVGDGCDICNPEKALELDNDKIRDNVSNLIDDLIGLSEHRHDDLSIGKDAAELILEYQRLLAEAIKRNWLGEDYPKDLKDKILMFCNE